MSVSSSRGFVLSRGVTPLSLSGGRAYPSVDVAAVRPLCCHIADEVFRGQEPGPAASRSVSAADVVLYGVNLILPLMSQDLLKVREERNGNVETMRS